MTTETDALTLPALSSPEASVPEARDPESSASQVPDGPLPEPLLTIRPSSGWAPLDAAELWRFRELFWIFAARDIKVRYKQTVLGGAWALIQPLVFTVLGTVVFGRLAGAGTDGVRPAFLFYLVSQLPWMLFNTGLQTSAMSLVGAGNDQEDLLSPNGAAGQRGRRQPD